MAQQAVGIGLIGCGTVGGGVARLLGEQADLYRRRLGRAVCLRRVLVRDPSKGQGDGFVDPGLLVSDADSFFATEDMPIVVEVAGGLGPIAAHVRRALSAGKHVVTANKSLLADQGPELFAIARQNGVSIAFEASCGGGIPVVTALAFGLMANRIESLYGILNGTSNYILTAMTRHGKTYDQALQEAQIKGFAEADPTLDVSGLDAAQKLAVLASIAFGGPVDGRTLACEGIDTLDQIDIRFGAELGYDIKLLAIANRSGASSGEGGVSLWTGPCFIRDDGPLAQVRGAFNALLVDGHAVGQTMYYGPGAGAMPTASAVVSDVLNVASGWYPKAFASMNLWPDDQNPIARLDAEDRESRFYLRINAKDTFGVMAKVSAILGQAQISLSAVRQHEPASGCFVPVVIVTHRAREGAVRRTLGEIEALDVIDGCPVCIRIVDLPGESVTRV